MKKKILILVMCLFSLSNIFSEEKADKILKDVEYKCIPYICDLKWSLKTFFNDGYNSDTRFIAKKNGDTKFMFYTYYPNAAFGNVYLRIEKNIWEYYPFADVTTRSIMRNNILNSNINYFDVLFDDLLANYDAQVISDDNKTTCIKLTINNTNIDEYYPVVLLYIDNENTTPIKREYFSSEGKKLKTITFSDYKFVDNKVNAFSMKVVSELDKTEYSTASFSDICEKEKMENKYFTFGFLKNWMPDMEEMK